ncbi:MAG: hypothetical protein OXG37_00570 [Actinomycetia bacterium]|nr:hypothetical protein [Actinomycetes bacterium]
MDKTPGEKKRALLSTLGLAELLEFRDTLVKAANAAKHAADNARGWQMQNSCPCETSAQE